MKAADIMTREVISVDAETTISEAARLMVQHHISGLPVTDESGAVVGIVTEGDLLRRAELGTARHRRRWIELLLGPGRMANEYVDTHARKVGEVMTRAVASAAPQDELADVVEVMEEHRVKRLPVIDNGRMVGIISRANLVRALLDNLAQKDTASAADIHSDRQIRDRIRAVIDKEPWGPRFSVTAKVKNGIVELHGSITDERERQALRVAAENVPGVKAVRDHLIWVEPVSGMVIDAPRS